MKRILLAILFAPLIAWSQTYPSPVFAATTINGNLTVGGALGGAGFLDVYAPMFGTGVDGSVTISGGTTTLTRDMHYTNLTITGGTLATNGFRVYVSGTLDLSFAPAGAIIAGQSLSTPYAAASAVWTLPGGNGGRGSGTGGTGAGSNGNGGNPGTTQNFPIIGGNSSASGNGGAGTNGGGTGANPLYTGTPTNALFPGGFIGPIQTNYSYTPLNVLSGIGGGSGGVGGGDGTNAGGNSGGGGNSSAAIGIWARNIQRGTNSTAAIISAVGTVGGNGSSPAAGNTGGGGGGSGGGGGGVYIVVENLLGSTITNAIDVSGGAGGTGGNGHGTGGGGNGGGSGGSGQVQIVNLGAHTFTYSTWSSTTNAGSAASGATGGAGGAAITLQVNL